MENITTKKCTKCNQELPITDFFKNKSAKMDYSVIVKNAKMRY